LRWARLQQLRLLRIGGGQIVLPSSPALHADAPSLSRPLQLARKGRASLRRAGKRKRSTA